MDIYFEKITSAPTEQLIALYQSAGWWKENADAPDILPKMLNNSFCVIGAKESSGRIIGMGRAISDGFSDAYIQDVVVLNEFRGHGIGAKIVERLVAYCLERKVNWVGLIAEPGTKHFYERLGFQLMKDYQPMLFSTERNNQ